MPERSDRRKEREFGEFQWRLKDLSRFFQGRGSLDPRRSTVFKPGRSTLHCWAPRQSRPHGNRINTGRTLTVAPPSRSRLSDRRIGPFWTVGPAPRRRASDGAPFSASVSPSRCLHLVQRRSIEPARRRGSRPVAWLRGGRRARAAPRLARSERRACGRGGADAFSLAK